MVPMHIGFTLKKMKYPTVMFVSDGRVKYEM